MLIYASYHVSELASLSFDNLMVLFWVEQTVLIYAIIVKHKLTKDVFKIKIDPACYKQNIFLTLYKTCLL